MSRPRGGNSHSPGWKRAAEREGSRVPSEGWARLLTSPGDPTAPSNGRPPRATGLHRRLIYWPDSCTEGGQWVLCGRCAGEFLLEESPRDLWCSRGLVLCLGLSPGAFPGGLAFSLGKGTWRFFLPAFLLPAARCHPFTCFLEGHSDGAL